MAFTFDTVPDNSVTALRTLLRLLRVRVTNTTLTNTLQGHPDYPSLLALSQALNLWKVENVAARLTADQLSDVPTPFVAHRNDEGGTFNVVRSLRNGIVEWQDIAGGWRQEPLVEFVKQWSGAVLIAEANDKAGEVDFAIKYRREQWRALRSPMLLVGSLIVSVMSFGVLPLQSTSLVVLGVHLAGIVVCGLLVAYSLDQSNPLVRQFCQLGGQTNCHSVLNSPRATLGGLVSLSEIGLVYFVGGWLAIVLAGLIGNPSLLLGVQAVLFGLTLIALPLTFVSIWYQGFVLKQWCVLCLTVLGLIWIEAVTNWLAGVSIWDINSQAVRIILVGQLLTTLLWSFVKLPLSNALAMKSAKKDLLKFKNDPALFMSLLRQQPELRGNFSDEAVIRLGRITAPHTLTIFTSPTCGPCALLHKELNELMAETTQINVNLVFSASDAPNDTRRIVAETVLTLPSDQRPAALDAWFTNIRQDSSQWRTNFTTMNATADVFDLLAQHKALCSANQIEATPTVYVDRWRMPTQYNLKEIVLLLFRLNELVISE